MIANQTIKFQCSHGDYRHEDYMKLLAYVDTAVVVVVWHFKLTKYHSKNPEFENLTH